MMEPALEIRKLPPRHVKELATMLETHELWKRLMSIIPKKLERENFTCDITAQNHRKYNSEHFRLIEMEAQATKRLCTEILFEEWGTSGRIRPTLGHLLYLLSKAKVFRAADYVAETLLHQPKPTRPDRGPEAPITMTLHTDNDKPDLNTEEIEKILDEIDYPSQVINMIRNNSLENKVKPPDVIPEIVITPNEDEILTAPVFNAPLVIEKERSVSDMIKFSTDEIITDCAENEVELQEMQSGNVPRFSEIVTENDRDLQSTSDNMFSESISESMAESQLESKENIPKFSIMMSEKDESKGDENIPRFSELLNSEKNAEESRDSIPKFSALLSENSDQLSKGTHITRAGGDSLPDFEKINDSTGAVSYNIPNLSALNFTEQITTNDEISSDEKVSSTNSSHLLPDFNHIQSDQSKSFSRPCSSPLPNLSLNTVLPHFNYSELEAATNNFDEIGFKENGRLLGKGAFGAVFLGLGLLDKPLAVKKLVLQNVEVVNLDDTVTKQFRNEVEVLSRYKHDNLLELLGYSCDGCTYCLIYEYIPGGTLRHRLQDAGEKLVWKDRLYIAFGTSKAVAYLHTAFSTPLIHRDIKSLNILLDDSNKPKLCDFGLIKLTPTQNTSTATTVFGTSAYMAPEAFRGDISVKMDTFSYGVVLLELLTSLPPMDENREGTDLVTHVSECDDMHSLLDKTNGTWEENGVNYANELFNLATKCLEEKRKRPTMVEVKDILHELMDKVS